jgi:hypothetical protein
VSGVAENRREQDGGNAAPTISGRGTAGHTGPGRWIGRLPSLHDRAVASRRETVVMPIERLLTCQIKIMRYRRHVYDIAEVEPFVHRNDCYGSV